MKMEKKQNIQNRIEEIYNGNKKIPFMQSKDILLLGYTYGLDDSNKNIIDSISKTVTDNISKKDNKTNISKEKQGFTGTTKELIETTNKLLKNKNDQNKQSSKITKEVLSKKEKYDLLVKVTADILANFNINKDFLSVYDYVQTLNKEYQDKLFYIKRNIEFSD